MHLKSSELSLSFRECGFAVEVVSCATILPWDSNLTWSVRRIYTFPFAPVASAKTSETVSILFQEVIHDSNSDCHVGVSPPADR